jgi:hypothetical protein
VGTNGGEITQLTHSPGLDMHPVWSPDSKWICFASARGGFKDEHPLTGNPQPYGTCTSCGLMVQRRNLSPMVSLKMGRPVGLHCRPYVRLNEVHRNRSATSSLPPALAAVLVNTFNTVGDFSGRRPGLKLLLLGLREPCSRFSCAKPCFAFLWSGAWLPTPKRQHGWRFPKFCHLPLELWGPYGLTKLNHTRLAQSLTQIPPRCARPPLLKGAFFGPPL